MTIRELLVTIAANVQPLMDGLNAAENAISGMKRQFVGAKTSIEEVEQAAAKGGAEIALTMQRSADATSSLGRGWLNLRQQGEQLRAGLSGLKQGFSDLSAKLHEHRAALLGVGAAVTAISGLSFKSAMSFELLEFQLRRIAGSEENFIKLRDQIETVRREVGAFTTTEIMEGIKQAADTAGISIEKIMDLLPAISKIAAAQGDTIGSLFTDLRTIAAGGDIRPRLAALIGAENVARLREEFKRIDKEVENLGLSVDEVLARKFSVIFEAVQQAAAGIAQPTTNLNRSVTEFKDSIAKLQVEIGERFLPLVSPALNFLNNFINAIRQNEIAVTALAVALGGLASAFAIGGAVMATAKTFALFKAVISGASGAVVSLGSSLAKLIPLLMNPIGLAVAGASALALAILDLVKGLQDGESAVANFVAGLMQAFGLNVQAKDILGFIKNAVSAIGEAWGKLVENVQLFFKVLWDEFSGVREQLGTGLAQVSESLKSFLASLAETLRAAMEALKTAFEALKPVIVPVLEILSSAAIKGSVALFETLAGVLKGLATSFAGLGTVISGALDVLGNLLRMLTDLATFNFADLGSAFEGLKDGAVKVSDGIVSVFQGLWSTLSAMFLGAAKILIAPFQTAWDWLKKSFDLATLLSNIVENAGKAFGRMFDWLTWPFQKALDWFKEHFNIGKVLADAFEKAKEMISGPLEDLTTWIRSWWPFSPAKIGPLRDIHKAGEGFVDQIADGMMAAKSRLSASLKDVTNQLQLQAKAHDFIRPVSAGLAASQTAMRQAFALQPAFAASGGGASLFFQPAITVHISVPGHASVESLKEIGTEIATQTGYQIWQQVKPHWEMAMERIYRSFKKREAPDVKGATP